MPPSWRKAGHGQIVAAMAEPGVGKSRLFFEFKADTSRAGWCWRPSRSRTARRRLSAGDRSAARLFRDRRRTTMRARGARRSPAGSSTLDRALEDTLPYLFALLGIVEGDDPLAQMDGQIKKRRTLEAIKRILLRESLNQPLMVIFEDLHWIDEETQELLNLLADSIGTAKILLLVNYRPEYSHQWGSKTYYTQLRLDPLGQESADEMLTRVARATATDAGAAQAADHREDRRQSLLHGRDGAGAVRRGRAGAQRRRSSSPGRSSELKIPPTVQAILAARIDRLPPMPEELLQTLAVIGRNFRSRWFARSSRKPDDELNRMLDDLQLGEFIYEQPAVGDIEYIFKHALTQEVAYNSVLVERRKLLHERIGAGDRDAVRRIARDHLANLAHHYARSGNPDKAVELSAPRRAAGTSAFSLLGSHRPAYCSSWNCLGRCRECTNAIERSSLSTPVLET